MVSHATHCTFCDLIKGSAEVSVCYEDADAVAFMDIQPVNPGHVLVVPRQHMESLFEVPRELGGHLFDVTMRVANAVRGVTGCEDMNIVVNSGVAAGQDELHYHVHIIPRRKGDGFDIQLPFDGSEMPDRQRLDAMAARIIAALRDPMRTEKGSAGGGRPGERAPVARKLAQDEGAHGELRRESAARDRADDELRRETADRSRQARVVERELPRAVAVEGPALAAAAPAGGGGRLFGGEGPHGELVREETAGD